MWRGTHSKTLVPSLGSFSGGVVRKFFLGVLDDCTVETNGGVRGELHCVLLNQSGNSQEGGLLSCSLQLSF